MDGIFEDAQAQVAENLRVNHELLGRGATEPECLQQLLVLSGQQCNLLLRIFEELVIARDERAATPRPTASRTIR